MNYCLKLNNKDSFEMIFFKNTFITMIFDMGSLQ